MEILDLGDVKAVTRKLVNDTISVKKTGYKDWSRKMKVSGGSSVRLNAELEKTTSPN